jgi:metal-responsive CopG/Arc/MetJ family transcriptional regulator
MAMRLLITLDDDLVGRLDSRVGRRQRSAFISAMIRKALDDERRWDDVEAGFGALAGREHEWDVDPAAWVQAQRHDDLRRVG